MRSDNDAHRAVTQKASVSASGETLTKSAAGPLEEGKPPLTARNDPAGPCAATKRPQKNPTQARLRANVKLESLIFFVRKAKLTLIKKPLLLCSPRKRLADACALAPSPARPPTCNAQGSGARGAKACRQLYPPPPPKEACALPPRWLAKWQRGDFSANKAPVQLPVVFQSFAPVGLFRNNGPGYLPCASRQSSCCLGLFRNYCPGFFISL